MTEKEKAYEKLLNRVAGICETNQHVDFGLEEANKEFKAISNQIAVGIQEVEKLPDDYAVGEFGTVDVLHVADEDNVSLTEAEASEILDDIARGWDANDGINWDTIRDYIAEFVDKRDKGE
tara:strand:+ start:41 stop:403 length:363 start_codon:yes stop_codon:yes gene_type:complete